MKLNTDGVEYLPELFGKSGKNHRTSGSDRQPQAGLEERKSPNLQNKNYKTLKR